MKNCIVIRKTKSKVQPFRLTAIADNSEPLEYSETLTTRENIQKHILAMLRVFNGSFVKVNDTTFSPVKSYLLYADGRSVDLES